MAVWAFQFIAPRGLVVRSKGQYFGFGPKVFQYFVHRLHILMQLTHQLGQLVRLNTLAFIKQVTLKNREFPPVIFQLVLPQHNFKMNAGVG